MKKKLYIFSIVSALLLLIAVERAMTWVDSGINNPLSIQDPQIITINEGMFANQLLNSLSGKGIIDSSLPFKVKMRLNPELSLIKVGTYELLPGMTGMDMLTMFSYGQEKQFSVSLVEGLTWSQWKQQLSQTDYLINDITDGVTLRQSTLPVDNIEGVLLAETYHFTANARASEIVQRAHQSMQDYLQNAWHSRALDLPLNTPYEALILASIVEKETGLASERPLIAGVFMNRLRKNMRLQTDPTVIYGMGESFDGNIRRKDLRTPTPYNTYVIKGLPPTPIAMPGRLAIDAVMNPQETEALFFVAKGDGSHYFSETLEEHNQAVRKYQLNK